MHKHTHTHISVSTCTETCRDTNLETQGQNGLRRGGVSEDEGDWIMTTYLSLLSINLLSINKFTIKNNPLSVPSL